jgi:predicted N-acyltransferase
MTLAPLKIRWCHAIQEVDPSQWNALVTGQTSPFLHWEWLYALEKSGSATKQTGWLPCHLVIEQGGSLVAALPMYAKGHSNGEFVFDQEWANVARQLGERYYPKLIGMAPFTPATGYRPLVHPDLDQGSLWPVMVEAIDRFCQAQDISICSFLYVDPDWRSQLEASDFSPRITHNYQWRNNNYQTFDDFLNQFNANQRRNIRRERAAMEKSGIQMKVYAGDEIPSEFFKIMYKLYSNTCEQFYNWSKYLNRDFFQLLDDHFREHLVFVTGERADDHSLVGMSFCVRKQDRFYGRYWGSFEEEKFLHFNACYYEPIDWAIQQGIRIFDPGAGGQHKIRRGFPATPLYSYHRFYRPQLKRVILPYLAQVNPLMLAELDLVNQQDVPFREDVLPQLSDRTRHTP